MAANLAVKHLNLVLVPLCQGRHFNFFLGGQHFFKFFNATGLLKNWKNSTLYVVIDKINDRFSSSTEHGTRVRFQIVLDQFQIEEN